MIATTIIHVYGFQRPWQHYIAVKMVDAVYVALSLTLKATKNIFLVACIGALDYHMKYTVFNVVIQ